MTQILLCRRVAKSTGATVITTLADMDGSESFDASSLGACDEVRQHAPQACIEYGHQQHCSNIGSDQTELSLAKLDCNGFNLSKYTDCKHYTQHSLCTLEKYANTCTVVGQHMDEAHMCISLLMQHTHQRLRSPVFSYATSCVRAASVGPVKVVR